MAIFKIFSQGQVKREPIAQTSLFTLSVVMLAGDVVPGLDFTAYCTHHPFTVTIRQVKEDGVHLLLDCETTWSVYERLFDDAVVNTSAEARRDRFFYDHDNKYGLNTF